MSDLESINKHLEELRKRILRIVLVIGIITVVVLTCHAEPIELGEVTLYYPMQILKITLQLKLQIT